MSKIGWKNQKLGRNSSTINVSQLLKEIRKVSDKGPRDSIEKESSQNSYDERINNETPPLMHFKIVENAHQILRECNIYNDDFTEIQRKTSQSVSSENDLIDKNCLIIEDYNTNGLIGDFNEDGTNYYSLFRNFGSSPKLQQEKSSNKGGSKGLGIRSAVTQVSDLSTLFAYSKRADNSKIFGGLYIASKPEKQKDFIYLYLDESEELKDGEADWLGIKNENFLEKIETDFGLRKLESKFDSGTSIIIPKINEQADAFEYALSIARFLKIQVFDRKIEIAYTNIDGKNGIINKDNLLKVLTENKYFEDVKFIDEFYKLTKETEPKYILDEETFSDYKVKIDDLERNGYNEDEFRKTYNEGDLLSIRIKLKAETAKQEFEKTFIDIFLKKPEKNSNGQFYIARNGRPLENEPNTLRSAVKRPIIGLLNIEDPVVSEIVRLQEPTDHSCFETKIPFDAFKEQYQWGEINKRILFGIRNSFSSILDILYKEDNDEKGDDISLADDFPIEDDSDENIPEPAPSPASPKDIPEIPPADPEKFKFSEDIENNGFRLSKNEKYKFLPTDKNFSICIKISWRMSSGTKYKYESLDINLDEMNKQGLIKIENINNLNIINNTITFSTDLKNCEKDNFTFHIHGFKEAIEHIYDIKEV